MLYRYFSANVWRNSLPTLPQLFDATACKLCCNCFDATACYIDVVRSTWTQQHAAAAGLMLYLVPLVFHVSLATKLYPGKKWCEVRQKYYSGAGIWPEDIVALDSILGFVIEHSNHFEKISKMATNIIVITNVLLLQIILSLIFTITIFRLGAVQLLRNAFWSIWPSLSQSVTLVRPPPPRNVTLVCRPGLEPVMSSLHWYY